MSDDTTEENLPLSEPLPVSGWIGPVKGWTKFVAQTQFNAGNAPETATLTPELWDRLWTALGKACNTPYRSDVGGDLWEVDWDGDCEDKCLAMREQLMDEGWPKGALRLVLCVTESGEDHCVLSTETDRGVFILDERARSVVSWRGLPYTWVAREHPGYSLWERITVVVAGG